MTRVSTTTTMLQARRLGWTLRLCYYGPETEPGATIFVSSGWFLRRKSAEAAIPKWRADIESSPRCDWLVIPTHGVGWDDMRGWLETNGHPDPQGADLEDIPDGEIACRVQELHPGGLRALAAELAGGRS